MNYKLTAIEELMIQKINSTYEKYRNNYKKNKLLMRELKKALYNDVKELLYINDMLIPPFDPFKIPKVGKVQIRVEYLPRDKIGADGTLEVVDNEFIIKIDESLNEEKHKIYRLRSTMAHELMHTFFYDTSKLPPRKLGHNLASRKHFLMEEELCNFLARELLMPAFSIRDLLTRKNILTPSVGSINFFKSKYIVSSDLVAYRLILDLNMWNAIFIKFVQKGPVYWSITKLKNKSNWLYKKIKIPSVIPSDSSDVWSKLLSNHILNAIKQGWAKDYVNLYNHNLRLESSLDSKNPVSAITIICLDQRNHTLDSFKNN